MIPQGSLPPVRRAACALTAGPSRATGFLVSILREAASGRLTSPNNPSSAKGLFVTSHAALGYHVEVEIENEAGDRKPGRVVAVDVARDLTFVLATDGLPRLGDAMAPLVLREMPSVKLGEQAVAVAALPNRGLRVWPATICALPRSAGPLERFDTDADPIGPAGGPLVDADGRVIGILVRDPAHHAGQGFGSPSAPSRALVRRATALPAAELRAALRPIESASDLPRRSPIYRCPTCTSPFVPDLDSCLACGLPLPHPFPPDPARASSERALRDALAGIGLIANRVRTGARTWQLPPRTAPGGDSVAIHVELDPAGATLVFRAPVARLPKSAREPFYRLILTLNDQSTGAYRLALDGDRVLCLFAAVPSTLREHDLGLSLSGLVEMAEHFRKILQEGFDAAPLLALSAPPEW